jgi:deazaflavin-dependent oxidoreductase (nitroreductase family)
MLFGQEHVDRYRATDGEEGYEWQGTQTLLLTTKGRKTGEERTTPLIFAPYGDRAYTIVASKGGSDEPPAWYLNLSEDPEVEVQVKGDVFKARARTASAEEKPEIWKAMVSEWPSYDEYQTKTDREIPVVILERINASAAA